MISTSREILPERATREWRWRAALLALTGFVSLTAVGVGIGLLAQMLVAAP